MSDNTFSIVVRAENRRRAVTAGRMSQHHVRRTGAARHADATRRSPARQQ